MKVALCFIISYEHILNKEQLWINWIKPNQDIINIYFHYKNFDSIKSPWIKAYTIPPKIIQNTTYYNVVPAYMSILTYAYEHDKENQWFCLLTDSCVPIISPSNFRKLFMTHYQASIIKCKPSYWDIRLHQRANLRLLEKDYWLANDPWFTLCRNHVHKCILFVTLKNKIYHQINSGGLANESMFAIILKTFGEMDNSQRHINDSSTIADWTRMSSPTSPHLFKMDSEENNNIIKYLLKENKYAMFLRKVSRSFPDDTILRLMDYDCGHEYDANYGKARQRKSSSLNAFLIYLFCALLLVSFYLGTGFLTEDFMDSCVFSDYM
jgi:hypothetical protein